MKFKSAFLLILVALIAFSCADNMNDMGMGIQPISDGIAVATDTFPVETSNVKIESIVSRPDSFLLGKFYNQKNNSYIQADILTQFKSVTLSDLNTITPKLRYPVNSVADSAVVILLANSWFGDRYASSNISVYEMNKSTFSFSQSYNSNLNVADYCDKSTLVGSKVFSVGDGAKPNDTTTTSTKDSTYIRVKLTKEFAQQFFNKTQQIPASDTEFSNAFKGLYITTNMGASCMLNISGIRMYLYRHFSYNSKTSSGKDTIMNELQTDVYAANKEVTRVNRIYYPNQTDIANQINSQDQVNYISTPANFETKLTLPLASIRQKLNSKVNGKKLSINSALMRVDIQDIDSSKYAIPTTSSVLLIKEGSITEFFRNKSSLPSDTVAILATHTAVKNATTSIYEHYYTFNLAGLISHELLKNNTATNLTFRIVPVQVGYNSSGTVTSIKQSNQISAVTIKSGKNKTAPMRLKMVYSGF